MEDYSINENHIEYYQFLEELRKSGTTNMFGATPYLVKAFKLKPKKAGEILKEWMHCYEELNKRFGWQ